MPEARRHHVAALGCAQMIAWASSTYLPALLAPALARQSACSETMVFAAYSFALLVMAALGPAVGRRIDREGGRPVLCLSSLLLAAGLTGLAGSTGPAGLFAAWSVIGAGMALGLYDAAFAALVRQYGLAARSAITGITLLGGFASTLGWPLTRWLVDGYGCVTTCLVWAAANLLLALPLYCLALPGKRGRTPAAPAAVDGSDDGVRSSGSSSSDRASRRDFLWLAIFGAATAAVTSAMAAHLPALLVASGLSASLAIAAAALVGPAQVAARLGELLAARRGRLSPLRLARLATALHPLGAVLMLLAGGPAAAFAILHGAGNGMITIAKGTLPLVLFGPHGYGALQGRLAVAQRLAQAAGPYLFALVLAHGGSSLGLAISLGLSLLALLALAALRLPAPAREPAVRI